MVSCCYHCGLMCMVILSLNLQCWINLLAQQDRKVPKEKWLGSQTSFDCILSMEKRGLLFWKNRSVSEVLQFRIAETLLCRGDSYYLDQLSCWRMAMIFVKFKSSGSLMLFQSCSVSMCIFWICQLFHEPCYWNILVMYVSLCDFLHTRIGCRCGNSRAFKRDRLASISSANRALRIQRLRTLSSFSRRNPNNLKFENPKFSFLNPKT